MCFNIIIIIILYSLLGVQSVDEVVRHGILRWFGHVERKNEDDCHDLGVGL